MRVDPGPYFFLGAHFLEMSKLQGPKGQDGLAQVLTVFFYLENKPDHQERRCVEELRGPSL